MPTINDLLISTSIVRQYPNEISKLKVDFVGLEYNKADKSVKAKAFAKGSKVYNLEIIFDDIDISEKRDIDYRIEVSMGLNKFKYIKKIDKQKNRIKVRCDCDDYRFTWAKPNQDNSAFAGENFKPYARKTRSRPVRNANQKLGLCKHLITLITELQIKKFL